MSEQNKNLVNDGPSLWHRDSPGDRAHQGFGVPASAYAALPEGEVEGEAEALVLASHLRFFGAGIVRSALTHPMVMGRA